MIPLHSCQDDNMYPSAFKSEVPPLILPPTAWRYGLRVCDHVCVFVAVFRALLPERHVQDVP